MNNTPDIPVYLFTGFLEAGKTKFIQETLEDKRFCTGERTLLLVCEDRGRLHLVFFKGEDQAAAVIFDGDAGRFWLSHLDDHIPQIMNALRTIAGRNA